jgi:hypothetical protein
VTMRHLRPAPATTRRWPRTGSACRPATRCRNAGSPRCSDAYPAAGREPESPRHGHRTCAADPPRHRGRGPGRPVQHSRPRASHGDRGGLRPVPGPAAGRPT